MLRLTIGGRIWRPRPLCDPKRFSEFKRRYKTELRTNPLLNATAKSLGAGKVTLLYAAKDSQVNHAVVLAEALRRLTA